MNKIENIPAYYKNILYPKKLKTVVDKMAKTIKKEVKSKEYSIAYMGNSGALLAGPLSIILNKPLMIVRKDADKHHDSCDIQGLINNEYIIVDDLISSGDTVAKIINKIKYTYDQIYKIYPNVKKPLKCHGIFLHRGHWTYGKYFERGNEYTDIPVYTCEIENDY